MVPCPWGEGTLSCAGRLHACPCAVLGTPTMRVHGPFSPGRVPHSAVPDRRSRVYTCVFGHTPVLKESSACSHKVNARTQSPAPNAS